MNKQNVIFLLLSFIVVFFILLVGILLAEQLVFYAILSLFVAMGIMGFGFRLKRKWNS